MHTAPLLHPSPFRLRDLLVDPTGGLVTGPGGSVRLEPRVMAVLDILARHSGMLVSRAQLLEAIWPGGDVYDEALTQSVYQLRGQLVNAGGSEDYRKLIRTLPKRGYQLDGEVLPAKPSLAPPAITMGWVSRRRPWSWALVALVLLAVAWAVLDWAGKDVKQPVAGANTIAVLPFLPLSETQRDPVLEIGMADTLITRLSRLGALIVRPVNSVRRHGGLDRDPLRVGRDLGVGAVVDGSLQRAGDMIRVTVRLLRVADGAALWAASFDQPYADIFTLQDAICDRIASALAVKLAPTHGARRVQGGTNDTDAYEQYLEGRFHLARLTRQEMLTSAGHFRRAVALDPEYSDAWLGLANVLFRLPIAGETLPLDTVPEAKAAARRALELDETLAEAHAILGWIAHWYDWDWAGSEALFQQAIALNSNDLEAHLGYAHLLSTIGRHEDALAEIRRAREIAPLNPLAAALEGAFLLNAGKVEAARQGLQAAIEVDAGFWMAHMNLATVYAALDRHEEALAEVQRARELFGDTPYALASEIHALARVGRDAEAREQMDVLLEIDQREFVPPYDLALAHLGLGHVEMSLAWLQRGLEVGDPKMALLANDARFETIRDRDEFRYLLRQLNLGAAGQ